VRETFPDGAEPEVAARRDVGAVQSPAWGQLSSEDYLVS